MADSILEPQLQVLAKRFERFAHECRDLSSPLYERLTLGIAADPEILALAAKARKGQPVPNLFFGAVHLLLLKGTKHSLAAFYPSIRGVTDRHEDSYPHFQSFCHEHWDKIVELLTSRIVQTNVV